MRLLDFSEYNLVKINYYKDGGSKNLTFHKKGIEFQRPSENEYDVIYVRLNNSLSTPELRGKFFIDDGVQIRNEETINYLKDCIRKYENR